VTPRDLACPFCNSAHVEEVAAWAGQLITRQMRCLECNSYFEALRDEFDAQSDTG
jgi:transcriptional regulator NrdR family protein